MVVRRPHQPSEGVMKPLAPELLDSVNRALSAVRPLNPIQIDFRNPYFTQPKNAERRGPADLYERLAGTPVQHVYVHVPFCATRCTYCHYPTVTNVHTEAAQQTFLGHVDEEIDFQLQSGLDLSRVMTVHVGGGTPNCLSAPNFDRLLRRLQSAFHPRHELAVELYPSSVDLNEGTFQLMQAAGVNRVSLGIQTFDEAVNERNQRINQPRNDVIPLIGHAKRYCDNVSLDLLYGQKGQTLAVLEEDCRIVHQLDVNSVYLYQTRELMHRAGTELMLALNSFLCFFFEHGYEIVAFDQVIKKRNSNGFCEHRSGRSLSQNLLGIGPGAVSEIDAYIFRNRDPEAYGRNGFGLADEAVVKRSDRIRRAEYLNRALRHYNDPGVNGMLLSRYKERFSGDVLVDFSDELRAWHSLELIQHDDEKIEITDLGMHFTQHINYLLLGHYK
jgi:oxygen-independent coproporphyrinogen-3 oxidase